MKRFPDQSSPDELEKVEFSDLVLVLREGPEDVAALPAVVLDEGELGEDAGGAGDDAVRADQLTEVELAQRAELLDERQVGDAHVDLLGDALVVREHGQHDRLGRLVEDLK